MPSTIPMQSINTSNLDQSKLCSFDVELINKPTQALIHQSARFLFITGGQGAIRIQNVDYKLRPGAMVAILPWQISEVYEVSTPLQYYIVIYRFDVINQIIKSFYNLDHSQVDIIRDISNSPVVYCDEKQQEKLTRALHELRDEVGIESAMVPAKTRDLGGVYITTKLVELMVLYLRVGKQSDITFGDAKLKIDPSELLQYMYNHLSEKLTLKELSKRFYMSESSISNYITQVTGLSFFDLLNEMRVGKTINFLLYTDLTMEELAEILGYVDAPHISKVFSARIGMRANEYRKTYQRASEICKVKESRQAYSIIDYIFRNYSLPITPQSVAAQFGISVQELQRTILYQVEKNFEDFLNYVRVNRASELLLTTDKSVLTIAVEVGYNTSKTLTRNFLKQRVMTPTDFRKSVQLQPSTLE